MLANFGTQVAMNQLDGTFVPEANSVLQDPKYNNLFNKDFSTILRKTQQKQKLKNGN